MLRKSKHFLKNFAHFALLLGTCKHIRPLTISKAVHKYIFKKKTVHKQSKSDNSLVPSIKTSYEQHDRGVCPERRVIPFSPCSLKKTQDCTQIYDHQQYVFQVIWTSHITAQHLLQRLCRAEKANLQYKCTRTSIGGYQSIAK